MDKIAIMIVFFSSGNMSTSISEKFETYSQCQAALEQIVSHYGEKYSFGRGLVDTKSSRCLEIDFTKD